MLIPGYRLVSLTPFDAWPYRQLTYPSYRGLLAPLVLGPAWPVVAIGAGHGEEPAGLALAAMGTGGARLLSVYVAPPHRRRLIIASPPSPTRPTR